MITHIGMLTLKPDASKGQRAAIENGLRALVGVVPGLQSVSVGQDAGLKTENAHLVFASVFDDEAAWRAYGGHPAHVAVVRDLIAPVLATKGFVQLADSAIRW